MKKNNFSKMDKEVFTHTFKNGLRLFLLPLKTQKEVLFEVMVGVGGQNDNFKENERFVDIPHGMAHFLEHILLKKKSHIDKWKTLEKNGISYNGITYPKKTIYYFNTTKNSYICVSNFLDILKELVIDENLIAQERRIILRELAMSNDNIYKNFYHENIESVLVKDPYKNKVLGTLDSLNKINTKNITNFYNYFYKPNNMCIMVSGNFKLDKMYRLIEKKVKDMKSCKIEKKDIDEPNFVNKEKVIIEKDIVIPKVSINYKVPIRNLNLEKSMLVQSINILGDINFSSTSLFVEELKNNKIIEQKLDYSVTLLKDYLIISISSESLKYEKLIDLVTNKMKKLEINKKVIFQKLKSLYGSYIRLFDDGSKITSLIENDILLYDKVLFNKFNMLSKINEKKLESIYQKLNLDNYSVCVMKSNKK